MSRLLSQYSQTLKGMEAYCFAAYAEALEVIPTTLAENAGLNPIAMVTELRNRHALGERSAGINVRKVSPLPFPRVGAWLTHILSLGCHQQHLGRERPSAPPCLDQCD